MPPLRFHPIFKRIRWGGRRLGTVLGKPIGPQADYAESWELSDHGDDQSIVSDGFYAGWTLARLVRERGEEVLGRHAGRRRFPLLVKFLDAGDRLSLQVHPDDRRARQFGPSAAGRASVRLPSALDAPAGNAEFEATAEPGSPSCECVNGKTEAWVILATDPGSRLYVGLKDRVDRAALERHLAAGTVEECLHSFSAAPGDCVFVPAGTVHAIGEGILLAEIQQSSDLTFRLDDWGRLGADGRPRALHVAEALDCTDFERGPVAPVVPCVVSEGAHRVEELVRSDYFVIRRHTTAVPCAVVPEGRFRILMLLEGEAALDCGGERSDLVRGQTVLLPAEADAAQLAPAGRVVLLETFLP